MKVSGARSTDIRLSSFVLRMARGRLCLFNESKVEATVFALIPYSEKAEACVVGRCDTLSF